MSVPVVVLVCAFFGTSPSTDAPDLATPREGEARETVPATVDEPLTAPGEQTAPLPVVDTPVDDAPEPTVDALIANAERLLEKQKHALALEQVRIVLDGGSLTRAEHARARVVEGRALAKTATSDEATAALSLAVVLGAALPTSKDPLEHGLFEAARVAADQQPINARAERASVARPGVIVTLVEDARGLVAGVRVTFPSAIAVSPTSEGVAETKPVDAMTTTRAPETAPIESAAVDQRPTTMPLTREAPVVFVPLSDGAQVLVLTLVDARGNGLIDVSIVDRAPIVDDRETSLTIANMPWLTVAGGTVMLVGAVGLATAGTLAALADKGSAVITPDLKLPLLVGVGAAALVAASGAAMVLVDQLLWAPGRTDDESKPEGP